MIDITFYLASNKLLLRVMGQLFVAYRYLRTAITAEFWNFFFMFFDKSRNV